MSKKDNAQAQAQAQTEDTRAKVQNPNTELADYNANKEESLKATVNEVANISTAFQGFGITELSEVGTRVINYQTETKNGLVTHTIFNPAVVSATNIICMALDAGAKLDRMECIELATMDAETLKSAGVKGGLKEWFKDVGYVMGYDSPDLNRAAWACSGTKLFSKAFFDTYMKDVCAEHGLTRFLSEPFTDVKTIREKTNIICMNFGTGYYGAHGPTEYCVLEDMDNACRMGHALIEKIGNTEHKLTHKSSYNWVKTASGSYSRQEDDEDEKYFKTLSGTTYTQGGSTYGGRYNREDWGDEYEDYWGRDYAYGSYGSSGSTKSTTSSTTTSSFASYSPMISSLDFFIV